MNILQSPIRNWLYWLAPIAILALLILWQVDWGRAFVREPPVESGIAPQPLALAVLPVYEPAVTPDGTRDAVERTLFNPTRRPAPAAVAEAAKPKIQRGQFALAGTLMVDGKATALLRETSGGKSRRVAQGETVNGMMVAEIRPDRVRLTLGDESEELALKLAVGPRTTIQPVVAGTAGGPISATARPAQAGGVPAARDVAEVLAERRRAARAAEIATQGLPPGAPIPTVSNAPVTAPTMPPVPVGNQNSGDPQWQGVYQRYQQPRR